MGTINLSKPLQTIVEKYMEKKRYATISQAANELIRIGLEAEEKRK